MHNCENCNCETEEIIETDAGNYKKRTKIEKTGKIFVCKRCFNEWKERECSIKKIIESDKDRKVILAGPGTGKTYIFRQYINKFNKDDSIYIVTFINNLVDDLKRDLEYELKNRNIKINTFHKFCYHLLKFLKKNYIYCADLTDLIIEDAEIIEGRSINKKILKSSFNNYRATLNIKFYFERGNYYNAVGNDNICFGLLKTLKEGGNIDLDKIHKQIIVDEYQDFNFTESSIIKIISENNKILIAGDDDQALYTFKDSNPKYIRELWEDIKFTKFKLPFCHRCPEVIVDSFNNFIKRIRDEGLLKDRKNKEYKCYFPDKYKDSQEYDKIFWYKTSIRSGNFKSIEKILVENIKRYIFKKEIEDNKLNFLVIYSDFRTSVCRKIKENVIKELKTSGLSIIDYKKKKEKDSLLIKKGYELLKRDKESNLGWRIIIKNDLFEGWKDLIKNSTNKNIFQLLSIDYKKKHIDILNGLPDEESIVEDKKKTGINLLFTNFYGAKGLSADHVFILFLQDGVFPHNPLNIKEDEVYKFLVSLTRSKKSLNLITTHPYNSKFINMLPRNNVRIIKKDS